MESEHKNATPAQQGTQAGTAKKVLFVGAFLGMAFYILLSSPFAAQASFLYDILTWFAGDVSTKSSFPTEHNSQNMALLAPAVNLDPAPPRGGGDIPIVDGEALRLEGLSSEGIERPSSSQISVHIVREGETLSEIAELYKVSVNTIAWANDVKGRVIHPGQELIILPITGVRHEVKSGETLATIATKYDSNLEEIASYNELSADASLAAGQVVIVPDGVIAATPAPTSSSGSSAQTPLQTIGTVVSDVLGYFLWPVEGGVKTQGIHGYNGIDIGAKPGTSIYAAAAGTVVVAREGGWNGGYGSYVVIQHGNGTQTLYAHANAVLVSQGAQVSQGELIARVGATGRATGNHLHFEVRGAKNPF